MALLAITAGVVIIANSGRVADGCELSITSTGCFLRECKELAAGLLGTSGVIFAAWIAWIAVQRQLRHAEELATS